MKMHLNLATNDLEASVAFYETLLGAAPVKRYKDYALFITDEPGLELALDRETAAVSAGSAHFGVVVDSTQGVDAAIVRLQSAGLDTEIEREETCCYAVQTKVWAADPDGRRWEVYTVHDDVDERGDEAQADDGDHPLARVHNLGAGVVSSRSTVLSMGASGAVCDPSCRAGGL